jgi:hypothetical protein
MRRAGRLGLIGALLLGAPFVSLLVRLSPAYGEQRTDSLQAARALAEVSEEDGRPHVTFVGFQRLQGGGGRVFVHLTAAPSGMQASNKDLKAKVSLGNMHIGARNNRYPLDLQNFNLPVTRVELKARDQSVDIELTLRSEVTLHPRLQKRPDGAVVLEIEVPAN